MFDIDYIKAGDALRDILTSQGLVLCRAADTTFALDGMREAEVLRELAHAAVEIGETATARELFPVVNVPLEDIE